MKDEWQCSTIGNKVFISSLTILPTMIVTAGEVKEFLGDLREAAVTGDKKLER